MPATARRRQRSLATRALCRPVPPGIPERTDRQRNHLSGRFYYPAWQTRAHCAPGLGVFAVTLSAAALTAVVTAAPPPSSAPAAPVLGSNASRSTARYSVSSVRDMPAISSPPGPARPATAARQSPIAGYRYAPIRTPAARRAPRPPRQTDAPTQTSPAPEQEFFPEDRAPGY